MLNSFGLFLDEALLLAEEGGGGRFKLLLFVRGEGEAILDVTNGLLGDRFEDPGLGFVGG